MLIRDLDTAFKAYDIRGTVPDQLDEQLAEATGAAFVRVSDTATNAAEYVDVKEDARHNLVAGNSCSGSKDPTARDNAGSSIRAGSDDEEDGVDTEVRGNRNTGNDRYGLQINTWPQRKLCSNRFSDNDEGNTNQSRVEPAAPC